MEKIGIPSSSSITGALMSAGIGALGGVIVNLSTRFLGTGLWGSLGGIALAGSILKDGEGKIISTVLGYEIGKQFFAGGGKSENESVSNYTVI